MLISLFLIWVGISAKSTFQGGNNPVKPYQPASKTR